MSAETNFHLPTYQTFVDNISVLDLPISSSELHGIMCGYLCAGAASEGEAYLGALTPNNKNASTRAAAHAIFAVYTVSQHQLANFNFDFQLLLPDEHESILQRALAFSEWCEGFTQGMAMAGVGYEQLADEESQEALQHMLEFAQLDYESLDVNEEDEKALVEVSEYARMAVIRLYNDLQEKDGTKSRTTH